jgi:hypothetical protein
MAWHVCSYVLSNPAFRKIFEPKMHEIKDLGRARFFFFALVTAHN